MGVVWIAFNSDWASSTDSKGSGVGSSDVLALLGGVRDCAGVDAEEATASFVAAGASALIGETEFGSGVPSREGVNPSPS